MVSSRSYPYSASGRCASPQLIEMYKLVFLKSPSRTLKEVCLKLPVSIFTPVFLKKLEIMVDVVKCYKYSWTRLDPSVTDFRNNFGYLKSAATRGHDLMVAFLCSCTSGNRSRPSPTISSSRRAEPKRSLDVAIDIEKAKKANVQSSISPISCFSNLFYLSKFQVPTKASILC
jgi:hypothetical protein